MSYELMINEEQRKIIEDALRLTSLAPGYHSQEALEEIYLLTGMFSNLKEDESNYYVDAADGKRKHILHGFCL